MLTRRRVTLILALAAVTAYMVVILANTCFFAAGPDSSGYLNEARLLAQGRLRMDVPPIRHWGLPQKMIFAFTPLGFANGGNGTMVPTYPPGLPVHMVVAAKLGGWKTAPFLVSPLLALGCLGLCVLIAHELGLSLSWGMAGAAILALFPPFVSHAVQPVSDVVATFWALAAVWCSLRALKRPVMAIAVGLSFAIGIWVRPTNILMALPIAFALRWRIPLLGRAVCSALPLGAALGWLNAQMYGKPWKTGYGSLLDVVTLDALRTCLSFHAGWLAKMTTPFIFPMGLLAAFDRKADWWHRALIVVWFVPFFLFYIVYPVCDEWFSARFLMPALPPLIFGFLFVARDSLDLLRRRSGTKVSAAIAALLLIVVLANETRYVIKLRVLKTNEVDSIYPETVRWAESLIPDNALVFAGVLSGAFLYHADRFTVRWDQIFDERFQTLRESAAATLPWYAVVSNLECSGEELRRRVPGHWAEGGRNRDVTLWRYLGPLTYEEERAMKMGASHIVATLRPEEATRRSGIVPIVAAVAGPPPDAYTTEAVIENSGDTPVHIRLQLFPSQRHAEIRLAARARVQWNDLVYQLFGTLERGWLQFDADQPVRARFWFVNRGRGTAEALPFATPVMRAAFEARPNSRLCLINTSGNRVPITVNGDLRELSPFEWFIEPAAGRVALSGRSPFVAFVSWRDAAGRSFFAWPDARPPEDKAVAALR